MDASETSALVRAAAGGDARAWDRLVQQYSGLVWAVIRTYRLASTEAFDVFQVTWLRLVEHLDRINNPERVGAWLATTARHEALRSLLSGRREIATDPADLDAAQPSVASPEMAVLRSERSELLWKAFGELPDQCRTLLAMLLASPPPSYADVAVALGMKIGSIGPTRGRCLDKLRELLTNQDVSAARSGAPVSSDDRRLAT
ncbi:MAG TPA: sigma-70 family RNA polymerase sigma factor [Actinomycetota bacterium]|nr:sigma-70 family RNA polymerase sigma factor [Actinomycetota bacterium]